MTRSSMYWPGIEPRVTVRRPALGPEMTSMVTSSKGPTPISVTLPKIRMPTGSVTDRTVSEDIDTSRLTSSCPGLLTRSRYDPDDIVPVNVPAASVVAEKLGDGVLVGLPTNTPAPSTGLPSPSRTVPETRCVTAGATAPGEGEGEGEGAVGVGTSPPPQEHSSTASINAYQALMRDPIARCTRVANQAAWSLAAVLDISER